MSHVGMVDIRRDWRRHCGEPRQDMAEPEFSDYAASPTPTPIDLLLISGKIEVIAPARLVG